MNLPIFKSLRTISCLNPKILKKCNPIKGTVLKLQTHYSKSSCKNASLPVAHPQEPITRKYPLGTGPHKYHWLEIRCSLTGTSLHCNLQVVLFIRKLREILDNSEECKGMKNNQKKQEATVHNQTQMSILRTFRVGGNLHL